MEQYYSTAQKYTIYLAYIMKLKKIRRSYSILAFLYSTLHLSLFLSLQRLILSFLIVCIRRRAYFCTAIYN